MHLVRLAVDDVKNLVGVRLTPHARLNVLVGDNGQGKTNLLEAIHLAAALRPLRPLERAADLVRSGAARGTITALFEADGPLDVEVTVEPKGRRASIAGKAVRDVGEAASKIGVVAFVPEDASVVRGGPAERRRALDRFAYTTMPAYAQVARRYEAALERRNRLLRVGASDADALAAYTTTLVDAGADVVRARARAAATWSPLFDEAVRRVGGGRVDAAIRYRSSLLEDDEVDVPADAVRARFATAIESRADEERRRGTTLVGPHLDDVVVTKGAQKARWLASQGEARAIVLALKIAAVRATTTARGAAPLFLLDDVAGELDPEKARLLFDVVNEVGSQTFVSATTLDLLPPLGDALVARVADGRVVDVRAP